MNGLGIRIANTRLFPNLWALRLISYNDNDLHYKFYGVEISNLVVFEFHNTDRGN